jgi:hypothetical protein
VDEAAPEKEIKVFTLSGESEIHVMNRPKLMG